MGDNTPPVTPPNPPATPPAESGTTKEQFRTWFNELITEREADTGNVRQSPSHEQSGQSLAQQVEAILTARERRSNADKRMTDLEKSNTDLRKAVEDLTKAAGKKKSSIFSIFDGL